MAHHYIWLTNSIICSISLANQYVSISPLAGLFSVNGSAVVKLTVMVLVFQIQISPDLSTYMDSCNPPRFPQMTVLIIPTPPPKFNIVKSPLKTESGWKKRLYPGPDMLLNLPGSIIKLPQRDHRTLSEPQGLRRVPRPASWEAGKRRGVWEVL